MSADNVTVIITNTDALTDRVEAWLSIAVTKAKVRPVPDTDLYTAYEAMKRLMEKLEQ